MLYRENGQFKTSYRADQQVFPIAQDRLAIWALIGVAVLLVPAMADEYLLRAIFIPFLILSLAAIGLNILVGYCGQISLGTGAFMAVGAFRGSSRCSRTHRSSKMRSSTAGPGDSRRASSRPSRKPDRSVSQPATGVGTPPSQSNRAARGRAAPVVWASSSSMDG